MKYELGCWTKRFSLCRLCSSSGRGCSKSFASYKTNKRLVQIYDIDEDEKYILIDFVFSLAYH